ncbi:PTB domain-containing adapter protein ced-6-like isoform X2 [Symsagittifera roscoffensis]|uniref:PTB domain-containing adapter protein ced-6-like isoform X2 n=1 Tax=Symsagittifera roscoffensis TaxID=84072 RepID=UPI00307CAC40
MKMKKILREYKSDKIQSQLDKRDREQNLWPHHPDKLLISSVEYFVKYYGWTGVSESQGDRVIKGAIQQLTHLSNQGTPQTGTTKPPRVYLNISADKVTVRESKIRVEVDKFNISDIAYVADDRAVKRVVALIVANRDRDSKQQQHKEESRTQHGKFAASVGGDNSINGKSSNESAADAPFKCHLFESEKWADEIVRTVGQAFDLGYRKFLSSDKREMQIKHQLKAMANNITHLQSLNAQYCDRINQLESILKTNKIVFPKSQLNTKGAKSTNAATSQMSTSGSVDLMGNAEEKSTHQNGKITTSEASNIPSLKPPPLPNRPRDSNNRSKTGASTSARPSDALLDLGDIPATQPNMYLDVSPYKGIQAEANDELAQLAMNRLGGVDMQPSQPTSPVEPGPASPLDYLNQSETTYDTNEYSAVGNGTGNTAYVNPFQTHSSSQYPDLSPGANSPNMPDLGSGLYFNSLSQPAELESELNSAARTLLDLGIDGSLFTSPPPPPPPAADHPADSVYSAPYA